MGDNELQDHIRGWHEANPPVHPFEVRIIIGGEDWDYVIRVLGELSRHIPEHGPDCNMMSGGAGGSHSVTVARRGISAEAFRKELLTWHERVKKDSFTEAAETCPAPDLGRGTRL